MIGITHSTASDDTFSSTGATAWDASHSVSGGTAGSILFVDGAGAISEDNANFKWGTTAGQGLTAKAGIATTDVNALHLTQTWNNAAVAFTGAKIVITDTASAAGSLAFQILGGAAGATNLLSLSKSGKLTIAGDFALPFFSISATSGQVQCGGGISIPAPSSYVFSGTTILSAGAVGTLTVYNGTVGSIRLGNASDTNLSFISAGLIGIGSGAAGSFAGSLKLTNTQNVGYQEFDEMTAPAGAANSARLFTQDNGAGKTQLMCIFGSGTAIQLAIEA